MTIEQVMAMIRRRGYDVTHYPLPANLDPDNPRSFSEMIAIQRGDLQLRWTILLSNLAAPATTADWRDVIEQRLVPLSGSDRHMQCRLCLTPVLRGYETRAFARDQLGESIVALYGNRLVVQELTPSGPREVRWTIVREEPSLWIATCFDRVVYRLTRRGPDSEPITRCPRCHVPIEVCVREIEDRDDVLEALYRGPRATLLR